MGGLIYHRTIIGYHGCDAQLAEQILLGKAEIEFSQNKHDWLGKGIYFWEHGPKRAMEWAVQRAKSSNKIKKPAVIGAYIHLGDCFDLLDTQYTKMLADLYPKFAKTCEENRIPIPENKSPRGFESIDHVCRYRDCAVINWCLDLLEQQRVARYQTVRCVFTEGEPAFEGSKIMSKSHIQIAIRDPSCILGFFRPQNVDLKALSA